MWWKSEHRIKAQIFIHSSIHLSVPLTMCQVLFRGSCRSFLEFCLPHLSALDNTWHFFTLWTKFCAPLYKISECLSIDVWSSLWQNDQNKWWQTEPEKLPYLKKVTFFSDCSDLWLFRGCSDWWFQCRRYNRRPFASWTTLTNFMFQHL